MKLLFSEMLVMFASPSGPMCLMMTLSGPVELFCFVLLPLGIVLW